ncbi:MAG: hypothetical protein ACLUGJ_02545 [Blautia wexlerae]
MEQLAMFYPGVQEELAELTGGDYYVVFPSVDGAMIHSVDGNTNQGICYGD